MSGGTINATKHLKRQGLDPHMVYEAEVVNNKDPRQIGRITARVKGIFDGIPDAALPWCIPMFNHLDGAKGGGWHWKPEKSGSGTFRVPKPKHKVGIKFPTGDPHRPVWTDYTIDDQTMLPEARHHYPDRAVFRFTNGCFMIIDTKTNEVILGNPGDIDICILGDVNQTVIGNQTLTVSDSLTDIPPYLIAMPGSIIGALVPKPTLKIPFKGLLGGSKGNFHTHVTGHQTTLVEGDRKTVIKGNDTTIVRKNRWETIDLLHRIQAARSETNG